MSVNVTVGNGQGITQAIKAHLQKSGVKLTNVKLSDWQKVMDLVNQNQTMIDKNNASNPSNKQDSIFTGGNDVSRIGANGGDNNWKTDFQVTSGQVMQFDAGIFNKIVAVLTGKAQEVETPTQPNTPTAPTTPTSPTSPENDVEMPDLSPKPQSLSETVSNPIPKHIDVPTDVQRQTTENLVDQLGGKIIEREVNGEKREISVVKHDGETIRRVINEDGTLGDTLVPISTLGKNKYITQTEMDNKMRTALGLPEDAPIPEDIKGSFVSIGGQPTLIFKKDGKTLDNKQLKEYVAGLKTSQVQSQSVDSGSAANVDKIEQMATDIFNTINNEYGDKKGNIELEEYINYELSQMDPAVLEKHGREAVIQVITDQFNKMDSIKDGQVTQEEIKAFLSGATPLQEEAVSNPDVPNTVDINNLDKAAADIFNTINNEYGDKKGNIELEEYINYELSTADPALIEKYGEETIVRVITKQFNAMDTIKDGQITQDEIKTFLSQADGSKDKKVSDIEAANYTDQLSAEEQNRLIDQNVAKLMQQGYELNLASDGTTYVYQKDGKTFSINFDGSIGAEIEM